MFSYAEEGILNTLIQKKNAGISSVGSDIFSKKDAFFLF